jgi:hypothetical protein
MNDLLILDDFLKWIRAQEYSLYQYDYEIEIIISSQYIIKPFILVDIDNKHIVSRITVTSYHEVDIEILDIDSENKIYSDYFMLHTFCEASQNLNKFMEKLKDIETVNRTKSD